MKELADNEELQENESWVKDRISLFFTAVFIVSLKLLNNYFEGSYYLFISFFLVILLFLAVQHLLKKTKRQPFNFKEFFRELGFYTLALLIGYNLINFTASITASDPDSTALKFLSFLLGALTLLLMIFAFQFIEKNSKI